MSEPGGNSNARSFWRENLVSICALFVSALSLYYAIDAQNTDREYKELAVIPHLSVDRFGSELNVFFKNVGIGPAVIRRVKYISSKGCVASDSMSASEWAEKHFEIENRSFNEFLDDAFSVQPDNVLKGSTLNTTSIIPGNTYSVGDKVTVFTILEARQIFQKMGENRSSRVLKRFVELQLPLGIEYCSLTGKSCAQFNMSYIDDKCAKLQPRPSK